MKHWSKLWLLLFLKYENGISLVSNQRAVKYYPFLKTKQIYILKHICVTYYDINIDPVDIYKEDHKLVLKGEVLNGS